MLSQVVPRGGGLGWALWGCYSSCYSSAVAARTCARATRTIYARTHARDAYALQDVSHKTSNRKHHVHWPRSHASCTRWTWDRVFGEDMADDHKPDACAVESCGEARAMARLVLSAVAAVAVWSRINILIGSSASIVWPWAVKRRDSLHARQR